MKKLLGLALITAVLLSGCGEVQISINKDQEVEAETGSTKKEKVDLISDESENEKMKEADKQKAILQFINEDIYKVAEYEVVAFQSLASVSGVNYTDDQTVYRELTTITIPAYEKALNEAQGIEAGIPELEEMADRVVTATQTFYDALILEKKAIEDQDEGLINESNTKMEEYYKLVDAYHSDMELLAEEYNVTYDLNEPKQNVEEL
ncbi:hypothetical protein N5C46_15035 [Rossellomorea vietnamensis]|uniref:Uncharacterized protein n=1 Tax=Rossellomorea vietnamensis TaxID=218284 RepID=A0ACD4C3B6_9BACI|nr:hypothetical protein [Rossellomorea vietnamensis]UXH42998.1 hypothetical protein N5C46_15035 [Rossellomorea vietnamensis]